jgi:hypothetical protein
MSNPRAFARDRRLGGSHFTAIGAFRDVTLGYFDRVQRDDKKITVREQVEVVSPVGDIAEGPRPCRPRQGRRHCAGRPPLEAHAPEVIAACDRGRVRFVGVAAKSAR